MLNSGATDADIAEHFEVAEKTVNNWKRKHPEFLQSIKDGKARADCQVVGSLFQRANGMIVVKKVPFKLKDIHYNEETGKKIKETERVELVEVQEEVPPDVRAQTHWLDIRNKNWKKKTEVDFGDRVPFVGMTTTPPAGFNK